MNVHEIDRAGLGARRLVFCAQYYLVAGDVMLARKIALETNELGALAVAKRFFPSQRNACVPC